MNLFAFIRLLIRNLKWLIVLPGIAAVAVVAFTSDMEREYISKTVVYTGVASGYDISTGESMGGDFMSVSTAFDNLIATINSRETMEDVGLHLLAQHLLLTEPKQNVLHASGFAELLDMISPELRDSLTVPGDFDATLRNLRIYNESSVSNTISNILAGDSKYSINYITGNLGVMRVRNSDMIELNFKANDPGVAQHTLFFAANSFMNRYKGLKSDETSTVIDYFETELNKAFNQLQTGEDRLKNFGIENRIINYKEQSKYIAASKEDLETQLYREKMKYEAAKAAILKLENKLADQMTSISSNHELQDERDKLGEIQILLTNARIYGEPISVIDSLTKASFETQESIKEIGNKYYQYRYSIEGVPVNDLLEQWLSKIIEYEEARANLNVFEERKAEFDRIYDHFAPLGSTLNKLEREVGISEQQYLSILHGLNMARLRQQNLEMSNTLSILDQPFFPINPIKSKRGLMVGASFGGTLMFIVAFLFLREFLDNSIQTPKRAEELTHLTLGAALPARIKSDEKKTNFDFVETALLEQSISSFSFELKKVDPYKRNYFIILFSVLPDEGKSWFAEKYIRKLSEVNGEILYLFPQLDNDKPVPNFSAFNSRTTIIPYSIRQSFVETNSWEEMVTGIIDDETIDKFHYTVLELPALSQYSFPSELVMKADLNVMVLNARRLWGDADDHLSNLYLNATMNNTLIMLNNVQTDNLETLLGEIPKKRSPFRKFVKRILRFDFRGSKSL